jgi:hypothetical protein
MQNFLSKKHTKARVRVDGRVFHEPNAVFWGLQALYASSFVCHEDCFWNSRTQKTSQVLALWLVFFI